MLGHLRLGNGLHGLIHSDSLMALHKAGLLPAWARDDVERYVDQESRWQVTPNIHALRSVSLAAKHIMARAHGRQRAWGQLDQLYAHTLARRAFYENGGGGVSGGMPPSY